MSNQTGYAIRDIGIISFIISLVTVLMGAYIHYSSFDQFIDFFITIPLPFTALGLLFYFIGRDSVRTEGW